MVDQLRDAKTNVNFTLEQGMRRSAEKQKLAEAAKAEYEREEYNNLCLREKLNQIESTIQALALVSEQSSELDEHLMGHAVHIHKAEKIHRGRHALDDPNFCNKSDVVDYFNAHPNTNVIARDVVESLPRSKQDHAKRYLPAMLAASANEGWLQRVGVGIYRLTPKSTEAEVAPPPAEKKEKIVVVN